MNRLEARHGGAGLAPSAEQTAVTDIGFGVADAVTRNLPEGEDYPPKRGGELMTTLPPALGELQAEALAAMQAAGLPFEPLEINSSWQRAPRQDHYWYIAVSGKANSDPLGFDAWPQGIDRRRLIDDLWALTLMHLPRLRSYEKRAHGGGE